MTEILAHVFETLHADKKVRPQDDLYRHVNGTWLASHVIPADRPIDGAFHTLRDESEKRGRTIVEDAVNGKLDDIDAEKIAILYSQFMDEDTIEQAGVTPILTGLNEIRDITDKDELACLAGRLMREGVGTLFGLYIGTNAHDSHSYMTSIVQAGIGLPDESYYHEDQYASIRETYVTHIARLLALSTYVSEEESTASAERIMKLETAFASHHRDSVTNRNPLLSDNPVLRRELAEKFPGFNWEGWATHLHMPHDPDLMLNVDQPEFVEGACREWDSADIEDLKLWLAASLIDARASLLSSPFVEENFHFHGHILAGTEQMRPRWKRALGLVEGLLGESIGRVWVARHFPPASKERMDELVANLLTAYEHSIRSLEWMSDTTKERALKKLATFNPKIGYPIKWRDYSDMRISAECSIVDNIRHAMCSEADREWEKLSRPVDRDEWFMTPQTVNAYYNPPMNEIVFPAAILQPPFFDPQADDAVNYGAIGAVIGHEIGHGFDDQGSRFDEDGNLENWWEDDDRQRFEQRTQALIDQYNTLIPQNLQDSPNAQDLHVNGALTIGENIGDLGGLSIAWKAWVSTLEAQGLRVEDAPVIDGITAAQRFFFAWARAWRTASRTQFAEQMLAIDPHSPAEFRCNQVVKNLDAFVEAFGVKPGDDMWLDEAERVTIW